MLPEVKYIGLELLVEAHLGRSGPHAAATGIIGPTVASVAAAAPGYSPCHRGEVTKLL